MRKSQKRLVDVAGIELSRIGVLSDGSIHYFGFQCFSTTWGICFSLEANSEVMQSSRTVTHTHIRLVRPGYRYSSEKTWVLQA
jgi:hypothetical protein